jgi:hypothetical protein
MTSKLDGEAKAKVHLEQDEDGKPHLVVRLGERDFTQNAPGSPDYPDRFIRVPLDFTQAFTMQNIIAETEFCFPRGIGCDHGTCFICGGDDTLRPNFAAFVTSKRAGERIVEWFGGKGAWLDYRPSYPNRIQVKITSCERHQALLERLSRWIGEDGTISQRKINNLRDDCVKYYEDEYDREQAKKAQEKT